MSDFLNKIDAPITQAILERLGYLARQSGAGLLETFGPSPRSLNTEDSILKYRPNVLNLAPLAQGFLSGNTERFENAARNMAATNDLANRALNVQEPDDPVELLARIVTPVRLPVPRIALAEKIANPALRVAAKVPQGAVNLTGAALTPGIQASTLKGAAAELGANELIGEGIVALAGPSNLDTGFQGLLVDKEGMNLDDLPKYEGPKDTGQQDTLDLDNLPTYKVTEVDSAPTYPSGLGWVGAATLAGGVYLGARGVGRILTRKLLGETADILPTRTSVGQGETPRQVSNSARVLQHISDTDAAVVDTLRGIDPEVADLVDAERKTMVAPFSLASTVRTTMDTGVVPWMSHRIRPLTPVVKAIGRLAKRQPQFKASLSDLIVDQSVADTMKRAMKMGKSTKWKGMDYPQLEASIKQRRDANPKIARMADELHPVWRDDIKLLHEGGLITREMHDKILEANPRYAHLQHNVREADPEGGVLTGLTHGLMKTLGLDSLDDTSTRLARNSLIETRINEIMPRDLEARIPAGEVRDPLEFIEQSRINVIRRINENRVRKRVVDALLKAKLAKKAKPYDYNMPIYRDGVLEYYQVPDYVVSWALFQPGRVIPIFNVPRHIAATNLTGAGNPGFVPIAQGYEMQMIAAARQPNRLVSLKQLLASPIRESTASMINELRNRMVVGYKTSLLTGERSAIENLTVARNSVAGLLGMNPVQADAVAKKMAEAYEASVLNFSKKYGALTTTFMTDTAGDNPIRALTRTISPEFFKGFARESLARNIARSKLVPHGVEPTAQEIAIAGQRAVHAAQDIWNLWEGGIRDMHFSPRASYLRVNRNAVDAMSYEDSIRLARDVLEVAGNPASTGSNSIMQAVQNFALYIRPTVQAAVAWGKAFKNNWQKAAIGLSGVVMAPVGYVILQSFFNDEFRKRYWEDQTVNNRYSIPLMVPGSDAVLAKWNVEHFVSMFYMPIIEALGEILGFKQPAETLTGEQRVLQHSAAKIFSDDEGKLTTAGRVFNSMIDGTVTGTSRFVATDLMNPGVAAAITLGSDRPIDVSVGPARFGAGARELATERITEDPEGLVAGGVLDARVELAMEKLFGLAFQGLNNGLIAANAVQTQTGDVDAATNAFLDNLHRPVTDRLPFSSVLFGSVEHVTAKSAYYQYYSETKATIRKLTDVQHRTMSGKTGFYPQQANSVEDYVRMRAAMFNDGLLKNAQERLSSLYRQRSSLNAVAGFQMNPTMMRKTSNELNKEIRETITSTALSMQMLEKDIQKELKRLFGYEGDFSFEDF